MTNANSEIENELLHSAKNNKLTNESLSDARARKELAGNINSIPTTFSHPPLDISNNEVQAKFVKVSQNSTINSQSSIINSQNFPSNTQQFSCNRNNTDMSTGVKDLDENELEQNFPTLFHEGFFSSNPAYRFLTLEYLARYIT